MNYRKELKIRARQSLKRHYALWVVLCLLMLVLSGNHLFTYSVDLVESSVGSSKEQESTFVQVIRDIISGNRENGRVLAEKNIQEIRQSKENEEAVLGRREGVLSDIVNRITSGAFLVSLTAGISSIIGSDSVALVLLIICGLLVVFTIWFLVENIYKVIVIRMFLEGMEYETVHIQRSLFFLKVKKWFRACLTMLVVQIYETLWWFTLIGGMIKHYSYYMVPYIVAENPDISPNEAITLSRRMMNGRKWECFAFHVTFIGWELLGVLTGSLVTLFFTNPYKMAATCEYYAMVRKKAKEAGIPGMELLNDDALFERPEKEVLEKAYMDVMEETCVLQKVVSLTGIRGFLAKYMGTVTGWGKKELEYEEVQAVRMKYALEKEELDGKIYPSRLCPLSLKESRGGFLGAHYLRCYSIWSLVMLFFIMSFGGWVWEVSLHLITDGKFVNRGVLHGPWLPIYGTGSVLILMLLYRLRRNLALEFIMIVVVCGLVEYFTAYLLEMIHHGQKWWDYTGYFLNLHGRICAEGLLVFGVGGMIIIYVLAPMLDRLLRKVPGRLLIIVGLVLILAFAADRIYSTGHPNTGKGITSTSFAK